MPSTATDSKSIPSSAPGTSAPQAPQPVTTPTAPPVDWMPEPSANHAQSVLLEVAQPDLGRVNIRMAVNQDLVHTYITSDRSEIGQFLANGQDKLQTAFQNAGLDMGQFRVDIDRQSAGRSFQQQTPQGQNHSYLPYREGGSQGHGNEPAFAGSSHRSGMLNLVA